MCTNFDALTNPYKLTPYRDSESGDSSASTNQIQAFCIALGASTTWRLFGLGVSSNVATFFYKDLTTGGSHDLSDNSWGTTGNNTGASVAGYTLCVFYKNTGLVYGVYASGNIFSYDPTGGASFNSSGHSLSYTTICQGVVHSKDDILYVGHDNKVLSYDGSSWVDAAITLPSNVYVTALAEYGNYLAIACAPLSGVGQSVVYLWDRDATLKTLPEIIQWGEGTIKVLHQIDSDLVGVSQYIGSYTTTDRVHIRYYSGSTPQTLVILQGATGSTVLLQGSQRIDNRILFSMSITLDGVLQRGVWSIGKSPDGRLALIHERTPNNDTAVASNDILGGFIKVGDYLFQTYTNSSDWAMSKTNDQASFTATSEYKTVINPMQPEMYRASAGTRSNKKQLIAALLGIVPLPSGASASLYYRVDGGSWTLWGTANTTGQVALEVSQVDVSGTAISTGREFEFKFTSTGGAEITEFKYKIELNETLL